MKFLIVFALALATVSAGFIDHIAVHPRDLPESILPEGRITNGNDAAQNQFPYQAGLSFSSSSGGWWCGGSLIGNNWILTAAHCTSGASAVKVYLGATFRTSPQQTYDVPSNQFVQHKSYNSIILNNDISLIKIPSVSYTASIASIALPKVSSSYSTYSGQTAVASGWGKISDAATGVTSKLQYANLKVIDNAECAKTYGSLTITSRNICTATPAGTSTCSGDSGGPLALSGTIIGVTSFVHRDGCQSGAPAGFVRVTSYLDWIKENTGISY